MLEDARQEIIDKNRLILELKYDNNEGTAIMPERFHYWSMDSNIFYKPRDPVGEIVEMRRRGTFFNNSAAQESRLVNRELLTMSHNRHFSREELREQSNLNFSRSEKNINLHFSHGHETPRGEQNELGIDSQVRECTLSRFRDDSEHELSLIHI